MVVAVVVVVVVVVVAVVVMGGGGSFHILSPCHLTLLHSRRVFFFFFFTCVMLPVLHEMDSQNFIIVFSSGSHWLDAGVGALPMKGRGLQNGDRSRTCPPPFPFTSLPIL